MKKFLLTITLLFASAFALAEDFKPGDKVLDPENKKATVLRVYTIDKKNYVAVLYKENSYGMFGEHKIKRVSDENQ